MSTYAIKADKFFLPAGPQLGGYLMVEDGVFGAWQADEPSCEIKDYTGSWIAPGMVDTHIHGFYNHSTTDNDPEGIDISSTELARRGTTSWLPTTFTDGVEQIKDACAAIANEADVVLVGSATINRDAPKAVWDVLGSIDAINTKGRAAGAFGAYGWSGEAPGMLQTRLGQLKFATPAEAFRVLFTPTRSDLDAMKDYARSVAALLK